MSGWTPSKDYSNDYDIGCLYCGGTCIKTGTEIDTSVSPVRTIWTFSCMFCGWSTDRWYPDDDGYLV